MKILDIRSVLIGVLCTALVFVLIGAKSQDKNLGDITVNSIRVVNNDGKIVAALDADEDGGRLDILNNDGKIVAALDADEDGGRLDILNNDGKIVAALDADEDGGRIDILNNDGKVVAGLVTGEGGGKLDIYNKHEKLVATLQSNKDFDGLIGLFDRYGDAGWGETGKQ